jgi:spore photoproduct lyase
MSSVKFKEYMQLDGQLKTQFSMAGQGRILRRFDKTPFPVSETDVVCPHFVLLAWANGCMYNCAWCYLKGTFRFYGQKPNGRVPMVFKSRERMAKDLKAFVSVRDLELEIVNTGELSDSLMDEGHVHGEPFSEWLMKFFKGTKHKVLFLTKSTNVESFLENSWQDHAVLSWSVNAVPVADRWETLAPPVRARLDAAQKVYDAGYEVRLRIDPMVPVVDWQKHYGHLVDMIYERLKPSRVTLGCLRGLASTIMHCTNKSWVQYLTEKSNWGKKPPFEQRLEMYQHVIDRLNDHGLADYAICKDTIAMWKALKLNPAKIKCNCKW